MARIKNSKTWQWFSGMDPMERLVAIIGIATALFAFYVNCGFAMVDLWIYECSIMAGIFALGFLPALTQKGEDGKLHFRLKGIGGAVLCVLGIAPCVYISQNLMRLQMFYGTTWTKGDIVMGCFLIVAMLELTRRSFGWAMPCISLVFFAYTLFGHHLPANLFGHTVIGFERTISYMFSPVGIFGSVMTVFARTVFVYLMFGAFLQHSGATDFFIDLASGAAGKWRGGPAKIAVIASALLGTINGNSVANVATTGCVTIPMMKRTGYPSYFAGAVAAVASTGGQILPPIMGTAAFIMAEMINKSYADVIVAAAIPAILYYVAVFMMVDLEAVRLHLKGLAAGERPNVGKVFRHGWQMLLPILALIYMLLIARTSVQQAGIYATVLIVLLSWTNKSHRMGLYEILRALEETTKSAVGIGGVIATAGLVIGTVTMTGLGNRFSSVVLSIANNNLYLVALFTALICIVLGMGLPTTAAYVIAVSVAVTTMLRIGVPPMAAHLFVFYFASISAITPPVAAAAYTGATIAKAPVMKTGLYASMLGIAGFIVPFIFISSPALLMQGNPGFILLATLTAVIGLAALANAVEGVCFFRGIVWNPVERIILASSSLFLIIPGFQSDLIGILIILAASGLNFLRRKASRQASVSQASK